MLYDRVNLFFRGDVVAKREFGRAWRAFRKRRVVGDAPSQPDGELYARLQVEEGDGTVSEFGADNTLRGEAKPVAVEPEGPLHVVYADGDDGDPWFHVLT